MTQVSTHMQFSLDSLKRCSGNTQHDSAYLAFFVSECVQIANSAITALQQAVPQITAGNLIAAADGHAAVARLRFALRLLDVGADWFSMKPQIASTFSAPRNALIAQSEQYHAAFVAACSASAC